MAEFKKEHTKLCSGVHKKLDGTVINASTV